MSKSNKIYIVITVLLLSLLAAISFLLADTVMKKDNSQIQQRIDAAFTTISTSLLKQESAATPSSQTFTPVLQDILWQTSALYAVVTNSQNQIIASSFPDKVPQPIAKLLAKDASPATLTAGSSLTLGTNTVMHYSRTIGSNNLLLHLGFSLQIKHFSSVYLQFLAVFWLAAAVLLFAFATFKQKTVIESAPSAPVVDNSKSETTAPSLLASREDIIRQLVEEDATMVTGTSTCPSLSVRLQTTTDDAMLLLNAEKRIVQCTDKFAFMFGITNSPEGVLFSDVFGESPLPEYTPLATVSPEFLRNSVSTIPVTFLPITITKLYGSAVLVQVITTAITVCEEWHTLIVVTDAPCLAAAETNGTVSISESQLAKHNQELQQKNALLRLENAEKSAVSYALRRAESRYRDIFDNAVEGIFQWTADKRLLSANRAFAKMLGFATVNMLMEHFSQNPFQFAQSATLSNLLIEELEVRGHVVSFEVEIIHQSGEPVWASLNARTIVDTNDKTLYYEAFIENISTRKSAEEKLIHQAFHDPLTGLANRALFLDRLRMALRRRTRQTTNSFAVLYLDLNRFKHVNDTYGHGVGDEVLCHAAVAILSSVRDLDTVARFGGDEFAVLLEDTDNQEQVIEITKRIHESISAPFMVETFAISIGASIGVVLNGEKYDNPDTILRDADIAMYKSKANQTRCYSIFTPSMRDEAMDSVTFERDLRQAVSNQDFIVEFQPIINLTNNNIKSFEALLRWRWRNEVLMPESFIAVAEETGLINNIGHIVLTQVCQHIVQWRELYTEDFTVHVNLSATQLLSTHFSSEVANLLDTYKIPPRFLRFEITQSILLQNNGACIAGVQTLRDMGIQFCLDDFGVGISSLSYLLHFPLDSIKIDRSFIKDVEDNPQALAFVRNLLALGTDLKLLVIIEGVERKTQQEKLESIGCYCMQGYYFSRALSAEKAQEFLLN